jgi:hypothetical protein
MGEIAFVTYFWLFAYFLIGATSYVLDKKYGIGIYNTFKKLTTNPDTYKKVDKGFLYNRSIRSKLFYGAIISGALSFLLFVFGKVGIETKVVLYFFETFFLVLGILLGPVYKRLLFWSKKGLDKMDDLEENFSAEETKKDISKNITEIKDSLTDTIEDAKNSVSETFTFAEKKTKEELIAEEKENKINSMKSKNSAFDDLLKK